MDVGDTTGADRTDMEGDTTAGAGGENVFWAPLVAGLGGLYSVGKAVDSYRFWNDYYQNTGHRARYPFRSGSYDWMMDSAMAMSGAGAFRGLKRF